MSGAVAWLDRKLCPRFAKNWDDSLFRDRLLSAIRPDDVILDLGAGAGIVEQMNFKGKGRRVCGVGLEIASLERIEGRPEYLRLSAPTYVAGAIYERIVNSTEMLAPFRVILIGHLRKAGA